MFKIGDEVMDKDGRLYTVMGVGFATYELLDSNGNMHAGVLEQSLAKADHPVAEALARITEKVTFVEGLLNEMKNAQADLFEMVRKKA